MTINRLFNPELQVIEEYLFTTHSLATYKISHRSPSTLQQLLLKQTIMTLLILYLYWLSSTRLIFTSVCPLTRRNEFQYREELKIGRSLYHVVATSYGTRNHRNSEPIAEGYTQSFRLFSGWPTTLTHADAFEKVVYDDKYRKLSSRTSIAPARIHLK